MTLVGSKVRNFRIEELLGKGGMGEVYVAFDEKLERRVALKSIRAEHRLSPQAKATTDQSGSITLDKENDLEIQVGSGFNGSAQVSAMTLYNWDPNKGNGQGSEVGSRIRSDPGRQPSNDVELSADGNPIRVTDVDTVADTRFCYTATVHDADGDHITPDPELIVKKKKKG